MSHYIELKKIMKDNSITQKELAKYLGIHETTMSLKLNGGADFTSTEMTRMIELYGIPSEEVGIYFFGYKSDSKKIKKKNKKN